ncbi:MAG: hypothetical protein KAJ31_05860 [Deltaproteobacteria bacterium]|nr:hypothetical protein [Deltaproteobacteria bacterium]MCK5710788.1 hypothetical protein [Deltaproteobacteria bacterium]
MWKKGVKVRVAQTIEGKKDSFNEGLRGTVVETFELPNGNSYRVQFLDGRMARFPEALMDEAVEIIE